MLDFGNFGIDIPIFLISSWHFTSSRPDSDVTMTSMRVFVSKWGWHCKTSMVGWWIWARLHWLLGFCSGPVNPCDWLWMRKFAVSCRKYTAGCAACEKLQIHWFSEPNHQHQSCSNINRIGVEGNEVCSHFQCQIWMCRCQQTIIRHRILLPHFDDDFATIIFI